MDKQSIGILISWREWKKLIQNKDLKAGRLKYYAEIGAKLNISLIFFPINKINPQELKGEAAIVRNKSIVYIGNTVIPSVIYCPNRFIRRESIKTLRELIQEENLQVINEHHIIKKKDFFELISSSLELKGFLGKEGEAREIPFQFYVLGQKNVENKWEITTIYAKDHNNDVLSFHDACRLIFVKNEMIIEAEELIHILFKRVFQFIQFYYPGIFELGLEFQWTEDGDLAITSPSPVDLIRNDLYQWNEELFSKVLQHPVKTAFELLTRKRKEPVPSKEGEWTVPQNITNSQGFLSHMKVPHKNEFHFWVSLKPFAHKEMIMRIPQDFFTFKQNGTGNLQFGVKELQIECESQQEQTLVTQNDNSMAKPLEIQVSTALVKEMCIPVDFVYQLKYEDDRFILGPTIGFVLGERNHLYNPDFMKKYCDRFGKYETFGGLVLAFSPRSIDWEKNIAYGLIYSVHENKWKYGCAPIPSVLYRRNFHQDTAKIQRLIDMTNKRFFNSHHFKKSDLYLMKDEPAIKSHLPATFLLKGIEDLIHFSKRNNKVILKPVDLSRGRGIYILEQPHEREGYLLNEYRKDFRIRHYISCEAALEEMLKNLGVFNKDYLFQKYISLLQVEGRPFDVRVVMQKYDIRKWQCSGIECRIAGKNEEITNIARGGKAMELEEIINEHTDFSHEKIQKKILRLSQKFCGLMEKKGFHYGEFGIDIALDDKGYPWILEANVFPSFKGFKEMDYETYLRIRYQPLFYSVRLQGFKTKEELVHEVYH